MAAAVVPDRRADGLRKRVDVCDQLLDRLLLQIGIRLQRRVQVLHVRAMMVVVVDLHGALVDVRLQGVVRVRQGGKGERHDRLLRLNPTATEFSNDLPVSSREI